MRAKWVHDGSHWANRWVCTNCGYKHFDEQTNYCANCGAQMLDNKDDDLIREKEQAYMKGWEDGRKDLIEKMRRLWKNEP